MPPPPLPCARASPAPTEEVGSEAGRGLEGLLQKMEHLQPHGIIGIIDAGTCFPRAPRSGVPEAVSPKTSCLVPQ